MFRNLQSPSLEKAMKVVDAEFRDEAILVKVQLIHTVLLAMFLDSHNGWAKEEELLSERTASES